MKRVISLMDFRDYCKSHHFREVVFDSVNQVQNNAVYHANMSAVFTTIIPGFSDLILKSKNGYIQFVAIKKVEIDESLKPVGVAITLVCGAERNDNTVYKLLANM